MIRPTTQDLGDPPPATTGARSGRVLLVVAFGLLLLLVLLRLVHLGADTPSGIEDSDGLYVDEGYKTLSPRNLVLFGTTHWSAADRYDGWMSTSPVTQWCYYASFRLFGVDIEAARYVTILFFAIFLLGFLLAMRGRYGGALLLGGLALLGLEHVLFFVSRVAIFEFPIITLFYGILFAFAGMKAGRLLMPVLLLVGGGVLLVFGIKVSALLYLTPVFLASSLFLMRQPTFGRPSTRWACAIVAIVALGALLVVTRDEWVFLLKIHPLAMGRRILDNPLVHRSPVPIVAGLLCAMHLLVCRPDLCLGNLYRLNLVSVALLGIPLVAMFEYDPMRYYAPLLPAFVLVVLEWIHLQGWTFQVPHPISPAGLASLVVVLPWLYYTIGLFLMYKSVFFSGGQPGVLEAVAVSVLAAVIWTFRSAALRGMTVASVLLALLSVFLVYNTRAVGSFLFAPTFQAQQIRSAMMRLLPDDSIVGGVWAPFFALGTPFKALYIAREGSPPMLLPEMAPDYLVLTELTGNSAALEYLTESFMPGVLIGPPLYSSTYNRKRSTLNALLFFPTETAFYRRGPHNMGRAFMRVGDPAAAEPNLRAWLDRLEQDPAVDPAWLAEARSDWGACLVQLGRHEEAEQALLRAYQTFRPGGEAPAQASARTTLQRLVDLYRVWNKPEPLARYRSLLESGLIPRSVTVRAEKADRSVIR